MNWRLALDLIRNRLPSWLLQTVDAAVATMRAADIDEFNVKHFSLSKIVDPVTMRDITFTRLKGALKYANPTAKELQEKIHFLDESIRAAANPTIWHAYYVEGDRVVNFLIDLGRTEILQTEYRQSPIVE